MLLVQKKSIFLYLFSLKTRLVIVLLNDFVEKKETFLSIKKTIFFIFAFKQKMPKKKEILLYLDLVKIRLEIMLKDFLEKKRNLFGLKQNFQKSKNSHFSKRVNPCFLSEKWQFFCLFVFGQNKTRNNT